jgi:hypothetical protein
MKLSTRHMIASQQSPSFTSKLRSSRALNVSIRQLTSNLQRSSTCKANALLATIRASNQIKPLRNSNSDTQGQIKPRSMKRKGTAKVDVIPDKECVRLSVVAQYLDCSPGTLENWISAKKLTRADGLREVGGLTRFHLPTLRARFAAGTLLSSKE